MVVRTTWYDGAPCTYGAHGMTVHLVRTTWYDGAPCTYYMV